MVHVGRWLAAGAVACSCAGAGWAQDDFAARYEALLIGGRLAEAEALAAARAAEAPSDAQAGFALGLAQFLGAVEGLGQDLYRFGLASDYGNPASAFGGGMPFLRIPIPANPSPEPVSYAGLRGMLTSFVEELAAAETTLAAVPSSDFALPLRVPLIRFDFDGNGSGAPEESAGALFLAVTGVDLLSVEWNAWAEDAAEGRIAPFGLDQSEVPWLQGYSHLLSALAEFLLAHDWEDAFALTFHDAFPRGTMPSSGLIAEERRVLQSLGPAVPGYDWRRQDASVEGFMEWSQSAEGEAHAEWMARQWSITYGGLADMIAFVHLMHWPVVEAERMGAAREHLLTMVALSRENWRRILAETDDSREWVPGPHQTVLLENIRITDQTVAGWQMFLDEFEAILTGERLIPHWRIAEGRGINLRRMFEEPATFDPLLIAQGSAILPYLEDGETVSRDTVLTILALTEGGLLGYFLWFN